MKSSTKLAFWVLLLFSIILFSSNLIQPKKEQLVKGISIIDKWSFNFEDPFKDNQLISLIQEELKDEEGEFAIYIQPLGIKDPKVVRINSGQTYPAGSLYKLFVMAAVLEEIEKGNLKEDTQVFEKVSHLEEVLGGSEFGYEDLDKDENVVMDVNKALERVASLSDNYAAIMLAEKISWEKVREQAKKLGASDTIIKAPISTTADDIGLFFIKLFNKQVVSEQASDKIINLLTKSKLNNRIPAKLPSKLKIAHKTGELPRVRHDAGIVYLTDKGTEPPKASLDKAGGQKGDGVEAYVIVLMSKDLKGEDSGVDALADVSKIVYDFYTNK